MTKDGKPGGVGRLLAGTLGAGIALFLVAVGVGYLLGQDQAPGEVDAAAVEAEAFNKSYARALVSSRSQARASGVEKGRAVGDKQGEKSGRADGKGAGDAAAVAESERIEAERAAAEAAAAEAAELALPEPCRGMPDSTARRMCIAAVERGDYP